MKSIDHVIMFQNLQVYVWRYATNLLDILQWFDGKNATDKAITSGLLVNDSVDRFGMWGESVNEHYKIWGDWLKKIDLESVDRELFDDCPDDTTLTNRLRIVKLRAGNMWEENEFQTLFHEVLYSFERLKSIVFATYEVDEPQAHKMAKQIHDNFTLKLIDVKRLQDYLQTVISKAENLLNPQSDTSTEQTVSKLPPELNTPQAHLIWSKAKHNGWINEDYQFNGTRQQMCYAADIMGESLKLKNKWKPFIELWGYKAMAQTRWRGKEGYEPIPKEKVLEKIFSI